MTFLRPINLATLESKAGERALSRSGLVYFGAICWEGGSLAPATAGRHRLNDHPIAGITRVDPGAGPLIPFVCRGGIHR